MNSKKFELPQNMKGAWIWSSAQIERVESYVFFKKSFDLDFGVNDANFWINARSEYHVFVNGRHVGYGPPASLPQLSYVERYDVNYCLEPGPNVIGILARHVNLPQFRCSQKVAGLWCQLDIAGEPLLWSDSDWEICEDQAFCKNLPQRGYCLGFNEKVNLAEYPGDWHTPGGGLEGRWFNPDHVVDLNVTQSRFEASPFDPLAMTTLDEAVAVARGHYVAGAFSTHVSFKELLRGRPCTYAAETFLFSPQPQELRFVLSSDDPFRLFLNDRLVKEDPGAGPDAVGGLPPAHPANQPECQVAFGGVSGKLALNQGWNRLLMIQRNGSDGMGFFLLFPGHKERLDLRRAQSEEAEEGWALSGPLRIPLALSSGSVRLNRLPSRAFAPTLENLNDPASYLNSCHFVQAEPSAGNATLGVADYVIYDLGRVYYGFPDLELQGGLGDIVDVVCGNRVVGGRVPPDSGNGRAVDTLLLKDGLNHWQSFSPKGIRYLMVTVRAAGAGGVAVENAGFVRLKREHENVALFECSDPELNSIWNVGMATLESTAVNSFLNSPETHQGQFLHLAMVQSLSSFYSFGDCALGLKALREFAADQLENGNIPALCPGGLYFDYPDLALLWPVWANYFFQLSGNHEVLVEAEPKLEALFDHIRSSELNADGLIADLKTGRNSGVFIDSGEIDRRGVVTAVNALYCRALLSTSQIYQDLGKADKAEQFKHEAGEVAAKLNALVRDPDSGLYADCFADGRRSDKFSMESNILALFAGVAEPDQFQSVFGHFFDLETCEEKHVSVGNNPYFKFFVLETACAFGLTAWAIGHIKYYWGRMLQAGASTWWGIFDPKVKQETIKNLHFCHGGGVCPNIFLIREVAGIRPALPGFTQIYFNPQLSFAKYVKATLPTPYGRIKIVWEIDENDFLTVQIDSTYPLDVVPMIPDEYLDRCEFKVDNNVNIFDTTGMAEG